MKVAIAGYGLEGVANYEYWKKMGADITIYDDSKTPSQPLPPGVKTVLGAGSFEEMDGFELVIRTASLRPDRIHTDGKVWSATNEFFAKCSAPIIGVTGTKGKGTTCSLITEILRNAGHTVHLVGNIGVPALEILPEIAADDIVIFELSSFQLWDLQKSPQTAVVLMIEPDHMDIHVSMEEYVGAKAHIAKFQDEDDLIVYHPTNQYSAQIARTSPAHKKQYFTPSGAYVEGGQIICGDIAVAKVGDIALIGEHNLENICAALTACWNYTKDVLAVQKALKVFKGLPHRLEFVRELSGVKYYNDSFSSAPGATIAAIKSFDQPEILICGGYDKHVDFSELASAIAKQKNIKKIILMGETRQQIANALQQYNVAVDVQDSKDFKHIIQVAQQYTEAGDVVLLSPGCSSFDMFKNFYDRGEQFKEIVNNL